MHAFVHLANTIECVKMLVTQSCPILCNPMDCQYRRRKRLGFDAWVRKIPWNRKWQTCSSNLAWKIPWMEEPGGLQSMVPRESDRIE